jgi:hypothetical protein
LNNNESNHTSPVFGYAANEVLVVAQCRQRQTSGTPHLAHNQSRSRLRTVALEASGVWSGFGIFRAF